MVSNATALFNHSHTSHAKRTNNIQKTNSGVIRTTTAIIPRPKNSPSQTPLPPCHAANHAAAAAIRVPISPVSTPFPSLDFDFLGRRSTQFVSKMHSGRPKTNINTRHTSIAEEVLQLALHNSQANLESILVSFESKLCGSDDYTFVLRELGNISEYEKAIKCFKFDVKRERRRTEQGKLATTMISIHGRLGKVELAKGIFQTALNEGYGNTVYAFFALISAFERSGYCDDAIKVFDSMRRGSETEIELSFFFPAMMGG